MEANDCRDEVICEFKVSGNRKKLWHCELEMLSILEELCEDNDINYFLLYGSALGAVRHRGFIPWDDDIDIGMIREDFDKFLLIARDYYGENYEIQYGYREPIYDFLLRVRDKRTTGIIHQEVNAKGCKGAFIEIYPFDHVNLNRIRKIQVGCNYIIYKLLVLKSQNVNDLTGMKRIRRILAGAVSHKLLWRVYNGICRIQNNQKSKYIDLISIPTYAKRNWGLMNLDDVKTTIKVPYEYTMARIPANYDTLLRNSYGNYMQLPPIEDRGRFHENIVYYDPNLSYTHYDHSDEIKEYFSDAALHDKI